MLHLSTPEFSVVQLREGYDRHEVDEFVARTLRSFLGPVPNRALADSILRATFTPRRLRPSYDMKQVDEFLDQLFYHASRGLQDR